MKEVLAILRRHVSADDLPALLHDLETSERAQNDFRFRILVRALRIAANLPDPNEPKPKAELLDLMEKDNQS